MGTILAVNAFPTSIITPKKPNLVLTKISTTTTTTTTNEKDSIMKQQRCYYHHHRHSVSASITSLFSSMNDGNNENNNSFFAKAVQSTMGYFGRRKRDEGNFSSNKLNDANVPVVTGKEPEEEEEKKVSSIDLDKQKVSRALKPRSAKTKRMDNEFERKIAE